MVLALNCQSHLDFLHQLKLILRQV